jgi:hypothetical protein
MKNSYYCIILYVILLASIITALLISSEWYLYSALAGIFVIIAILDVKYSGWILALLFIGEICTISAGYALFWLILPAQCAVIGIFMEKMHLFSGRQDLKYFIIFSGLIVLLLVCIDQMNHMSLPIVVTVGGICLFILYALISEFRLKKQYAGDNQ